MDHSKRKHALLSASGASRWINCPPSARMEDDLGQDNESSVFAEEGTLAHEFADLRLRAFNLSVQKESFSDVLFGAASDVLQTKYDKLRAHELYSGEDMDEYVGIYVDYVLGEFTAARKQTKDAIMVIEERTDFSHIVPEGFGTSDANIIADNTLQIIDLKYGKGVKVSAQGNSQMRLYALGLLRKWALSYGIEGVTMTIVQPRLDHIDSETLSVEELTQWAEEVVKPAAAQAYAGEGDCKAGDWCRWCKVKATCRALANHNLKLAKHEFADPKTLSLSELAEAYSQSDLLSTWITAVAAHLLEQALAGEKVEGYKVVAGRSVRKIKSEEAAIELLTSDDHGFELGQITNTKIKGIGELEKLVGKKEFASLGLTIKPEGKPTLVPESDKRPAIGLDSAREDFK